MDKVTKLWLGLLVCFCVLSAAVGFTWGSSMREAELANYIEDNNYIFCKNGTIEPIGQSVFAVQLPEKINKNITLPCTLN